jgi:hypothetical protein
MEIASAGSTPGYAKRRSGAGIATRMHAPPRGAVALARLSPSSEEYSLVGQWRHATRISRGRSRRWRSSREGLGMMAAKYRAVASSSGAATSSAMATLCRRPRLALRRLRKQRAGPHREVLTAQWIEGIRRDPDLASVSPKDARDLRLLDRDELRDRGPRVGDDDLLTRAHPTEELRALRLGLVDVE